MNKVSSKVLKWLKANMVMCMFIALSVACVLVSGLRMTAITNELMQRFTRNAFLILALLLPIVAGMGINFAITIGAMAAQIAILFVLNFRIPGIWGVLAAAALTVPLAGFFGWLIGLLLNRMKGQEMIGSLVLGYFANGLYQLLFLFIFGRVIPITNKDLTIMGGTGISNTIDLSVSYGIRNALTDLWKLPFDQALYLLVGVGLAVLLVLYLTKRRPLRNCIAPAVVMLACCLLYQIPAVSSAFIFVKVPMVTLMLIGGLALVNIMLMRTRLGQRFRAVGQSQSVSNASGIHVNRTRITAIVLSTIFAGWGQIIYLQSLGTVTTYSAHEQVGLYAGAAILGGGASVARAPNGQALLGCLLFHLLFSVALKAGAALFGDPGIGEHFRVFVSYGVIALALVMHGWVRKPKKGDRPTPTVAAE